MRLDEEKKLKKELAKDEDIILNIGKEGKKGDKYAKEYFESEEKREKQVADIEKEILSKKKKDQEYIQQLGKMLLDRLKVIELPSNWTYMVAPTDIGIVMELFNGKKRYRTAFKASFDRDVDINAVDVFALRAMHTAEKPEIPDNGIILPN